ncbi:glycosyltransferase [Mariniflexile ostreae]|uniref:Glycosyltransferase n=1 Tax=Mariniflexile ostreae TaxID=1520892 RepID=A0ABV5FEZ2_9FLAO
MKKYICLLTDSLDSGGAEKMAANMSISLTGKGYDVVVVSMIDAIAYSFKGTLYNFGKVKKECNTLQAFLKFRQFFKTQNFDVVIDHRVRNHFIKELLFSKVIFNRSKVIYCVHSYCLDLYFPAVRFPQFVKFTLVKNRKIVSVSKTIKKRIDQSLRMENQVIYNYTLRRASTQELKSESDFIMAVGRLVEVKQFDVLIKSYKTSKLPEKNIKLFIFGQGEQYESLTKLIQDLNLSEHVVLKGFKSNIDTYIKKAKALVMSSKSEGFPMVLIEALALKTPLISFDCKSGPNEIIVHGENGLLVEDQNEEALTDALNKLILDEAFYNSIKENLEKDLNVFSEEKIMTHWINLLNNQL